MATDTPNFNWPIPEDTDLVKDGAKAIRDLGNAIDTSAQDFGGGLVHIDETAIGSTVSAINVDNVFSSTFKNYKILINIDGLSGFAATRLRFRTGGSTNSTGNYAYQMFRSQFAVTDLSVQTRTVDGNTFLSLGQADAPSTTLAFDIFNPFAAKETFVNGTSTKSNEGMYFNGIFSSTTSFDGFQIFPSSGTYSGGNIRVYGYKD